MPVSIGVQWASPEEALNCGKGDIDLCFCPACGFIWNHAFDPHRLEYSRRYDNSLDFSPVFQDYAGTLARRLIESYGIQGKEVVELGCGKGHFLSLLCELGHNRGLGFDPSYEGDRAPSTVPGRITYIQDFYGERYSQQPADLVCCRHVFEHISRPDEFLATVKSTIGNQQHCVVYFEVPNTRFILEKLSVWDIIYEHCNYFTHESLLAVFQSGGFEVLRLAEDYGGQFLCLDARLRNSNGCRPTKEEPIALESLVKHFSQRFHARSELWVQRLGDLQRRADRAVIWGGGAKAVSFLNILKVGDAIPYVVDINPHKQGLHVPGTGQKIVPPGFLKRFRPQLVLLMNPIYRREVQAQLESMGFSPELIDV
jgi:SAM-dependent methyltransferase